MRGEYPLLCVTLRGRMELPPRARRIHPLFAATPDGLRTTSACAENTPWEWYSSDHIRNYLRVRGEYSLMSISATLHRELPPRARRIHSCRVRHPGTIGTTSACAENTCGWCRAHHSRGNYLRVRGEYPVEIRLSNVFTELPPRARRILANDSSRYVLIGTTSACAENTALFLLRRLF